MKIKHSIIITFMMQCRLILRLLNGLIFLLTLFISLSCSGGGGGDDNAPETYSDMSQTDTYSGSGSQVIHVDTSGNVILTHTLKLGTYTRAVYYIFTNVTVSGTGALPTVSYNEVGGADNALYGFNSPARNIVYPLGNSADVPVIRGREDIDEFNREPFLFIDKAGPLDAFMNNIVIMPPLMDAVDDEAVFYDIDGDMVEATCRKVIAKDTSNGIPITLNIFVADDCWHDGGTKINKVTQAMVDVMADRFLLSGSNNDIYEWVVGIFGIEWGAHSYAEFIGDNDEITILLYDISGDNSTTGGYLGAFYARDNVKTAYESKSNQRIMFYIDAVLYATKTSTSWEITDFWPQLIIATLAHEFQHMVHFYQKNILRMPNAAGSEIWLNEMCSEVTEDFLARKLQIDGPRGVPYGTAGAGSSGNYGGRLPVYNYYDDFSVMGWYSGDISYSMVYSFGAYLARNFGGVTFFRNLVHNDKTDYTAVSSALTSGGYGETFQSVMRKWGAAVLLSGSTTVPSGGYQYNRGDWFTSSIGGIDYDLGSINLFNYKFYDGYGYLTGPYLYTTSPIGWTTSQANTSNAFYVVGVSLTGDVKRTIKMEDNLKLTILVK